MVWTPVPPGAIGGQEVRMCHAVARRKLLGQPRTAAGLAADLGIEVDRAVVLIGRLQARGLVFQPSRGVGQLRPQFTCHLPLSAEEQRRRRLDLLKQERTNA